MHSLSFQNIYHFTFSLTENVIRPLSSKEKIILIIALAAISLLGLIYGCCDFRAKKADDDDVDLKLDDILRKDRYSVPHVDEDHRNKAVALFQEEKYVEALAECKEALKLNPKSMELLNLHGSCLLKQGLYDEAAVQFKEGLKIGPKNPVLLLSYATTLFKQKKYAEAKTYYADAMLVNRSSEVKWGYGNLLCALEDFKAQEYYFEALKLATNQEVSANLQELVGNGKLALAMVLCDEYLKHKDPAKRAARAENLIPFATFLRCNGKLDEAKKLIHDIYASVQTVKAIVEYAEILSLQGHRVKAVKYFVLAISKDYSAENISRLSYMSLREGLYPEAEKLFLTALRFDSKHLFSLNQLAFIYDQQGKLSEAKTQLQKVLKIKPNDVTALNLFADILVKEDKMVEAVKLYELSLKEVQDKEVEEKLDKIKAQLASISDSSDSSEEK